MMRWKTNTDEIFYPKATFKQYWDAKVLRKITIEDVPTHHLSEIINLVDRLNLKKEEG